MQKHLVGLGLIAGIGLSAAGMAHAEAAGLEHVPGVAEKELTPFESPGNNTFLDDFVTSGDDEAPITCGMFRMEQGEPLEYTYPYDEALFVVEGEMEVSDGRTTASAGSGDVLFIPKGTTVTFSAADYALSFYCGQREG
ncbi:cupin domain-containing protein [Methylonatrum kenyense]|uniref:cupin domain-containing protein n=1 Tax=Methylonatrum kenyense TaxID=455253 RepID=UPI0020BD7F36|nr:cupin domain-containing protein [Methylonatrum kenyense]MCK8517314.1 cupin domain-containing protein [Methylonatrum kenyense]